MIFERAKWVGMMARRAVSLGPTQLAPLGYADPVRYSNWAVLA